MLLRGKLKGFGEVLRVIPPPRYFFRHSVRLVSTVLQSRGLLLWLEFWACYSI